MVRRLALASLLLLAGLAPALPQGAGMLINTTCQQDRSDGRILASDGRLLPENWGFKVVRYHPTSATNDGWTEGTCVLRLTHKLRTR